MRGALYTTDAFLASVVAVTIFLLLLGYYIQIVKDASELARINRRHKLVHEVLRMLVYTPGGVLIGGAELERMPASETHCCVISRDVTIGTFVSEPPYMYPYWPQFRDRALGIPGLAVFHTGTLTPVPFVLHASKVKNLDIVADSICKRLLGANEGIAIKVQYGNETKEATAGDLQGGELVSRTVRVWVLETTTRTMHAGTLTVVLSLM